MSGQVTPPRLAARGGPVNQLRAFLFGRRCLALWLVMAAFAMKALVPAGYMVGAGSNVLTIEICADSQGERITRQIVVPGYKGQPGQGDHAKADGACPFTALTMMADTGADAVLLALALAFILALGFASAAPPVLVRRTYLRPPLRGPPASA